MNRSQPSLLDHKGLNVGPDLKESMNRADRKSDLSREEILDRMIYLAKCDGINFKVGLATFQKWLNPEEAAHLPTIHGIILFCSALGTLGPLSVIVRPLRGQLIEGCDIDLLELAKLQREQEKRGKRIRALKKRLGE